MKKFLIDRKKYLKALILKVGGEWAKNLYDKVIPNFLNKYGKKWNTKVGESEIPTENYLEKYRAGEVISKKNDYSVNVKVHSLDITPEMKEDVLYKGQPLFQLKKPEINYQLKNANKPLQTKLFGEKAETEKAREENRDPKNGEGNIIDFGAGLGQVFTISADKINDFVKNKNFEKQLGLEGDSKLKKLYREFLTSPQWFFDKEPQLKRIWDIVDRHYVRNVNEETAILKEDKWRNAKGWRALNENEQKEFLSALEEYEQTQYELQRDEGKTELLNWEDYADEFSFTPKPATFLLSDYKNTVETALDFVKDVDRYKIIYESQGNPYLESYHEIRKTSTKKNNLDRERALEEAKAEFFQDEPDAEFLFHQALLKMEVKDEVKALEKVWAENQNIRVRLADVLVDKKYESIDGKVYFPSSRLDKKYYLSGLKKSSPEEKLIEGKMDDRHFGTNDSLEKLMKIKTQLENEGYTVKIGKFKEAQEEILQNAITQEDILDLAISAGVKTREPDT